MTTSVDPCTEVLLINIDSAFNKRSWQGTPLRGALRGLRPDVALWKPDSARNSIWQLVLHAAHWKYIVRRHLTDAKPAGCARSLRRSMCRSSLGSGRTSA